MAIRSIDSSVSRAHCGAVTVTENYLNKFSDASKTVSIIISIYSFAILPKYSIW